MVLALGESVLCNQDDAEARLTTATASKKKQIHRASRAMLKSGRGEERPPFAKGAKNCGTRRSVVRFLRCCASLASARISDQFEVDGFCPTGFIVLFQFLKGVSIHRRNGETGSASWPRPFSTASNSNR
jgi:hypothetical protein